MEIIIICAAIAAIRALMGREHFEDVTSRYFDK